MSLIEERIDIGRKALIKLLNNLIDQVHALEIKVAVLEAKSNE